MADGVEKATVVCCFLTPEYQMSDNCQSELEYARRLKKRIIPCMLSDKNGKKWTPNNWLGLLTAGLNYIHMRDPSESNIRSKADELIDRIKNHSSDQPVTSGSQRENFFDLIREEYILNSFIHRIINEEKCFPIKESYINLAIVTSEEQRDKEKKLSQAEHKDAIIGTFEEIHSTKTVIDVKDMFEKCKGGTKKILVLGRAGIGKSTFCQYVTYQWAKGEIWTQYQLVVLIKLRMLTNDNYPSGRDYSPFDLVKKEYASRITMKEGDRSRFEEHCRMGQVLWLLDGYDEFVQNIPKQLRDVFELILNKYHHILTSRPYSITLSYDVKMEITGFTDDNIAKYIEQFFVQIKDQLGDATSRGQQLTSFLKSNPNIWGIAHMPVNLELICSLWGDIDQSQTMVLTMTGLYENITEWLLRRYLIKQKNLPPIEVQTKSRNDIYQDCNKELTFLESLAYNAMTTSVLILQPKSLEEASNDAKVTAEDKKHIFNIGVLKSFDGKATGNQLQANKEYYFVHLSFQEYFAARYLVNNLRNSTDQKSIEFIRRNKYNQRFTLVFVFASGLLTREELSAARKSFWDALFDEPVDLVGFRHMLILISCLDEISNESDISDYSLIIDTVSKWITYAVLHSSETVFEQLLNSLRRSIALSRQPIVRDQLIHLFRSSKSDKVYRISALISALSTYHVHPEHLLLLTNALNHGNWKVRRSACNALGAMGEKAAMSEVISKLATIALNGEDEDVWRSACAALRAMGEKAATSEVISKLATIALNDEKVVVRWRACYALGAMGEIAATSEVISKLATIALNDEKVVVRRSACNALGAMGEKAAMSEVISKLATIALIDENEDVRRSACYALGQMGEIAATSEVISKLATIALIDENEDVRRSACDVLGTMGEKAATSEVISKLVSALNDEDKEVGRSACDALGAMGEKAATSEVISKLVSALDDEDKEVRRSACDALGAMGETAAMREVINKQLSLLNDENEDYRRRACYVLGAMGEKAATSEVISKLVSALDDEDEDVRWRACYALGAMGEKAATSEVISKLVSALDDEDEDVRWRACYALGAMGEKAATSEVISKLATIALNDEYVNVRRSACKALGAMREKAATSEVMSKLATIALNDEDEDVRRSACDALGAMGEKAATSEVISKLVSALDGEDEDVRRDACYALGAMGEKAATSEVISKLVSALDTANADERGTVYKFLRKIPLSFTVLRELTSDTVMKLWSCIDRNLLKDLTFIPPEASIKVYLETRWSSWLSVATRATLLHGAAITITDDTIVIYGSKEPTEVRCSDWHSFDILVEAFSNQADRFELPRVRRSEILASADQEVIALPARQMPSVDVKTKRRCGVCVCF